MAPGAAPPTNSRASSGVLGPLIARGIVLVLGLNGVFAAGYGAFGTWAVANDWLSCVNPSFQPIGDYVSNYCETVSWPTQLGIGLGVFAVGVLAVGAAIWLLRSRFAA